MIGKISQLVYELLREVEGVSSGATIKKITVTKDAYLALYKENEKYSIGDPFGLRKIRICGILIEMEKES